MEGTEYYLRIYTVKGCSKTTFTWDSGWKYSRWEHFCVTLQKRVAHVTLTSYRSFLLVAYRQKLGVLYYQKGSRAQSPS